MSHLLLAALLTAALASPPVARQDDLPPLECVDSAGLVIPSAESPLRVGGEITKPELIKRVQPDVSKLPASARLGVVIVEAVIDREGKVCAARLLKGPPGPLADAQIAAVRQWRFKPATLNRVPVPVYFVLTAMPHPL